MKQRDDSTPKVPSVFPVMTLIVSTCLAISIWLMGDGNHPPLLVLTLIAIGPALHVSAWCSHRRLVVWVWTTVAFVVLIDSLDQLSPGRYDSHGMAIGYHKTLRQISHASLRIGCFTVLFMGAISAIERLYSHWAARPKSQ